MRIITGQPFRLVGIEARTSNARETTGDGVIPRLWDELVREGVLTRIANRTDSSIIALYTDYESDENGEYTYVLGARVSPAEATPQGMVAKQIAAGRYAVFTSERGPVAQVVLDTWKRIWSLSASNPGFRRSLRTDFEVYDDRAADPQNAQVEIHVGIQ